MTDRTDAKVSVRSFMPSNQSKENMKNLNHLLKVIVHNVQVIYGRLFSFFYRSYDKLECAYAVHIKKIPFATYQVSKMISEGGLKEMNILINSLYLMRSIGYSETKAYALAGVFMPQFANQITTDKETLEWIERNKKIDSVKDIMEFMMVMNMISERLFKYKLGSTLYDQLYAASLSEGKRILDELENKTHQVKE